MVFVNEIHGGTVLYNKNILIRVGGFDTDLWTGEEYDMNMCLLANGYKLGYVNEIVYRYRLHETNKSYFMSVYARIKRKEYIKEIRKRYYSYVL